MDPQVARFFFGCSSWLADKLSAEVVELILGMACPEQVCRLTPPLARLSNHGCLRRLSYGFPSGGHTGPRVQSLNR